VSGVVFAFPIPRRSRIGVAALPVATDGEGDGGSAPGPGYVPGSTTSGPDGSARLASIRVDQHRVLIPLHPETGRPGCPTRVEQGES